MAVGRILFTKNDILKKLNNDFGISKNWLFELQKFEEYQYFEKMTLKLPILDFENIEISKKFKISFHVSFQNCSPPSLFWNNDLEIAKNSLFDLKKWKFKKKYQNKISLV